MAHGHRLAYSLMAQVDNQAGHSVALALPFQVLVFILSPHSRTSRHGPWKAKMNSKCDLISLCLCIGIFLSGI